ncbi:hypothetical protein ACFY0P_36815 [Streptomyces sp. NPDC001714]|uniref:hypothetical protein n=1 Tax=Streptomyces sp. NPDC001714 TaxID=3364603 RepID=UPI0036B04F48
MSPRSAHRAPKGRNRDRTDRRAVLDVLLGRADRGALSTAEAALLREHVAEEVRLADENRRAMAGTTQALARHRGAADAAIRELEQRAVDAEEQLTAYRAVTEQWSQWQARAQQAEATLARVRAAATLGAALAAVAEHDGLSPEQVAVHTAFATAADSTEARLAEQTRSHAIELATVRRAAVHQLDALGTALTATQARAIRYRTAWFAARRDRRADRTAMAAELPLAQAVERVRALTARMRAGSPQGAAAIYADRIEQALAIDNEHQEQHA